MNEENKESSVVESFQRREYPSDVHILHAGGKEFLVVGTAHISQESADLVHEVIENEKPDCVCVELDAQRYATLSKPNRWESLNLREVIKRRQMGTLVANLILASYQKRLGGQLGVQPGAELLEAAKTATKLDIPLELCDRDVRITLRRAWRSTPFFRKLVLLSSLLASIFDRTELSEEKLAEIRQQDVLNEMLQELGKSMPTLKRVLIDERDAYLAHKILHSPGQRIVAVVGAGHVNGIREAIGKARDADLAKLEEIPPAGISLKILGWSIPALILTALGFIAWRQGLGEASDNLLWWTVANMIPAGIGALVAWGHPLTVIASALSAPITSLTPLIGAGYVGAFVQAMVHPPKVHEIQHAIDDAHLLKSWWKNRLLRVFLVLGTVSMGSFAGTWVGGAKILRSTFESFF